MIRFNYRRRRPANPKPSSMIALVPGVGERILSDPPLLSPRNRTANSSPAPMKFAVLSESASLAVIVNSKRPLSPTARPNDGEPPPVQFAPSAAPASNCPNGLALSLPVSRKFVFDPNDNVANAFASMESMLNTNPVKNPPMADELFVIEILSVPELPELYV